MSARFSTLSGMAEMMQFLGALVTIAGLVVVAPFEAGRALPALRGSVARTAVRARNFLSRWLPFLRTNVLVDPGGISSHTPAVSGSITGRMRLVPRGTPEEQVIMIWREVDSIYTELDGLRAEDGKIRTELIAKFRQLAEDHAALRQALEEERQEQGQINARGFPLAAVGALLAGVPGAWLPAAWWFVGGFLGIVGLVAAGVAALWLWGAKDKLAAGWHSV